MFILCRAAKNEPRKRAKGPNAPWIPATQKLLTLRVTNVFAKMCKFRLCVGVLIKKRQHGRHTQAVMQKFLLPATHPCQHKFQAKTESKFFANLSPAQHPGGGYPAVGCQGRSRRERPGVFSFAISLRRGKEMASKQPASACRRHSVSVPRNSC